MRDLQSSAPVFIICKCEKHNCGINKKKLHIYPPHCITFFLFQRLPSSYSSVSIQTDPSMVSLNLEAASGGGSVLNGGIGGYPYLNGGPPGTLHAGGGGGIHTICNGSISTLPRYSAAAAAVAAAGNDAGGGGNQLLRDLGDIDEQVRSFLDAGKKHLYDRPLPYLDRSFIQAEHGTVMLGLFRIPIA